MGKEDEPGEYEYTRPETKHGLSKAYFKKLVLDKRRSNRRAHISRLLSQFRTYIFRVAVFLNRWIPR